MVSVTRTHPFAAAVRGMFESARFSAALSQTIVATAFLTFALRSTIGWGGLLGILGAQCVLAAGSFIARRGTIEWQGLLPISILVFIGWCAASTAWSHYTTATLAAVIYQIIFAFLAVYLALVRDTIQVVRVVGDVLRILLSASIAIEVFSGLLIDAPIKFLGIQGNIAQLGPIQGLFGSRNVLGFVALVGLVTFLVELRTRSVLRGRATFSIVLAVVCLWLSSSPVIAVVLALVLLAMGALFVLRHIRNERRRFYVQLGIGGLAVALGVLAFFIRTRIVEALSAGSVLEFRYTLWVQVWNFGKAYPLQGWGWIGFWRRGVQPYSLIEQLTGAPHENALNAFLDVFIQVGVIGLILFVILVVLALSRSWLLASNKRSVVWVWMPLVLITLIATSMAESSALIDVGWMLLVLCAVKAAQGMSWRQALPGRGYASAAKGP